MTSLDDRYYAGFFDADGCVRITSPDAASRTNAFRLRVEVAQTTRPILEAFAGRFGGVVYGPATPTKQARPVFRWRAVGKSAEAMLRDVLPYLLVKRERAELGLRARTLMTGGRLSEAQRDERRQLFEQMRSLNERGSKS